MLRLCSANSVENLFQLLFLVLILVCALVGNTNREVSRDSIGFQYWKIKAMTLKDRGCF